MFCTSIEQVDFSDAWIDHDPTAAWRSGPGHGPATGGRASGSSLLEIPPGRRLPRHTDSAEETIVVLDGTAELTVGEEAAWLDRGGVALIPADVSHEVRNAGSGLLRFAAIYADTDVVTRYEREVQPDGERERRPVR